MVEETEKTEELTKKLTATAHRAADSDKRVSEYEARITQLQEEIRTNSDVFSQRLSELDGEWERSRTDLADSRLECLTLKEKIDVYEKNAAVASESAVALRAALNLITEQMQNTVQNSTEEMHMLKTRSKDSVQVSTNH